VRRELGGFALLSQSDNFNRDMLMHCFIRSMLLSSAFLSPISFATDLSQAINAFNEERLDVAKPLFEVAAKNAVSKNEALVYLGRIAFEEGYEEKAKEILSSSIDIEPNSSDEYYWLGRAYGELAIKANVLKQASYATNVHKYFQLAADANPNNVMAQRGLFEFYLIAPGIVGGSTEKAEQTLSIIRKLSVVDADIKQLALLNKKGDKEKSLAQARLLVTNYSFSAEALFNAGHVLREHKQFPESIKAFEAAAKVPVTRDNRLFVEHSAYHFSETCQWANIRVDEAIANLERLISARTNDKRFNKNWPTWTLAKLYRQKGDQQKFESLKSQLDPAYVKQDKWLKKELAEK
jgi:tetratricopeptide (TPR) repeat protein